LEIQFDTMKKLMDGILARTKDLEMEIKKLKAEKKIND